MSRGGARVAPWLFCFFAQLVGAAMFFLLPDGVSRPLLLVALNGVTVGRSWSVPAGYGRRGPSGGGCSRLASC